MKIIEKLSAKQDIYGAKPVTIAFLGDSVTQGCFECYIKEDGNIETVFDYKSAYSTRVREMLNLLYPQVQVNIINSGLSGDNAARGLTRLERDILPFSPDLVVVSYGLNDSTLGLEALESYKESIRQIITRLKNAGIEVIFLTQNYMNSKVSCHLKEQALRDCAASIMKTQVSGDLKIYETSAAAVAREAGAAVCDLYPVWEKLAQAGVDTTELLANKINHPIRDFHRYMAIKLIETMFEI